MVKWSLTNEGFEGKKRRGGPKVLNKAPKIVLKKARYKIGDSTRKPSPERVMKSECFKIRGPCDGQKKKTLGLVWQVTLSPSPICLEVQKPCCGRGLGWLSFSGWMPKIYTFFFLLLPKLDKYCLGVELAPAHQVIEKLKMDHLTPCGNGYRLWLKKTTTTKRACQLLKFWIHVHLREIWCKNKILHQSYNAWN